MFKLFHLVEFLFIKGAEKLLKISVLRTEDFFFIQLSNI